MTFGSAASRGKKKNDIRIKLFGMAIFGAGSNWDGKEIRERFFADGNYVIGWSNEDAEDLYNLLSSVKAGDILYLKADRPGALNIRVKGIGIVKESLLSARLRRGGSLSDVPGCLQIPVEWVCREEFIVSVPHGTGKLTNVRAATLYEESLPFVQQAVLERIFRRLGTGSERKE